MVALLPGAGHAQGILNDDAELFLPPGGADFFPATKAALVVQLGDQEQQILCSGPTRIQREDPAPGTNGNGSTVQTEILSMDLTCSGGVKVHLNPDPNLRSLGEINESGDSFFDVFFEISVPDPSSSVDPGRAELVMVLRNQEPARMQATIGHIPPIGSVYFGVAPVTLFLNGQPAARLVHLEHDVNGVPKPETQGEFSTVFSCFYECKWERVGKNMNTWQEITTLMLVNQSARQKVTADILFFDGNERAIATTQTILSPHDLDEINVCASLDAGLGGLVPPAGVIEVVLSPTGGVYGWVKNVMGRFPRFEPEPFRGRPTGIAKTQCRLVGPNVVAPKDILEKIRASDVRRIKPILIEGTAE
jgi:hypothetical protein